MSSETSKAVELARATIKNVGLEKFTAADFLPGTVRRVVLWKFKKEISEEVRIKTFNDVFDLKKVCLRDGAPYIQSIEAGAQVNGQGYDGGYEYVFVISFKSQGDANYYSGASFVDDPTKEENKKYFDFVHFGYVLSVLPLLENVIVTEYVLEQ